MASFAPWRQRRCCRRLNRRDVSFQSPAVPNGSARLSVLFFFCLFLLNACQRGISKPSIEFTKIPVAAVGGLDNMDTIEGRVISIRPEQRIVLYAKSGGRWWIQPFARDPLFTKIQGDSKWKNVTHLGEEYAALLVDPSYSPHKLRKCCLAQAARSRQSRSSKAKLPILLRRLKCSILAATIG